MKSPMELTNNSTVNRSTAGRRSRWWDQASPPAIGGGRLMMLVLHDDPKREYAYGPAEALPDTKVGTFSEAFMAEARQRGWVVISMQKDFKKIFAWE